MTGIYSKFGAELTVMKKRFALVLVVIVQISCNSKSIQGLGDADKVYSLKVKPTTGTKMRYEISNETKTEFEVNEKKIENIAKSEATVSYSINQDSIGNYLVGIKYEKIHVYSKIGENETDYDTEQPVSETDPVSQMFAALKASNISVLIKSSGEVVKVNGYQQILNHIFNGINREDPATKEVIQKQWQQMVEQSLVKKNLVQLFEIFPDSAVHVGDKWKFLTKQTENIAFKINNVFRLKSINNGVAFLESHGKITADSTATTISGYSATSSLTGEQDGEFEIDIKVGLPQYSKVSIDIDGNIQVNGRDIPFVMNSLVKMKGSQIN